MTPDNLALVMARWGFEIKPHQYKGFQAYLAGMLKKDRVMVIRRNGDLDAIIFYYLTDNYLNLHKKSTWEIAQDNPEGHQIYVDKMVCRHWTRQLRESIRQAIERKFPLVTEGIYHRAPFDRCVKISRGNGVLCSKI